MKKLTTKMKIRQVQMLKKNLKKMKKRKNKTEKDKKEAVEKQRVLPRSRQVQNYYMKKLLGILVLDLLITNTSKADQSLDQYVCEYADGSGLDYFTVLDKQVIVNTMGLKSKLNILKETKDEIIAGDDWKEVTFYRTVSKYFFVLTNWKKTGYMSLIKCERL